MEDINKYHIFEQYNKGYRSLERIYVLQNKYQESLEISEERRGKALKDLLSKKLERNYKQMTFEEIKECSKNHQTNFIIYSMNKKESFWE